MKSPDANFVIDCPDSACLPGQTISGQVLWELTSGSTEVILAFGWWTSGVGTVEEAVVENRTWKDPPRIGRESFSFTLPPGPYSFSGKLISLQWGLELSARGHRHKTLHRLYLSPTGQELDFSKASYESMVKSVWMRPS